MTVTGKRREDELLIWLYDASPAGVILPCACRRTRSTRQKWALASCMTMRIEPASKVTGKWISYVIYVQAPSMRLA